MCYEGVNTRHTSAKKVRSRRRSAQAPNRGLTPAVTLVVSVKYVTFILRADNDGEGGVMAH